MWNSSISSAALLMKSCRTGSSQYRGARSVDPFWT